MSRRLPKISPFCKYLVDLSSDSLLPRINRNYIWTRTDSFISNVATPNNGSSIGSNNWPSLLRSSDHILSTLPGAVPQRNKSTKNELVEALERRIKFGGPLTVAAYMTEILTHPSSGYYMAKDVLGPEGDFITSPEISQMFGELIGLWLTSEWINAGAPGESDLIISGFPSSTFAS